MIYADEHAGVRPMRREDIPQVLRIMQPAVEKGILVPRTSELLEERLDDFVVFEVDGLVHACGALHRFSGGSGEIAAIAVDESYASLGIGRRVVLFLLQKARKAGLTRAFALTTQTWDWFAEIGFTLGTVDDLPPERRGTYDRGRGSRVLVYPAGPGGRRREPGRGGRRHDRLGQIGGLRRAAPRRLGLHPLRQAHDRPPGGSRVGGHARQREAHARGAASRARHGRLRASCCCPASRRSSPERTSSSTGSIRGASTRSSRSAFPRAFW